MTKKKQFPIMLTWVGVGFLGIGLNQFGSRRRSGMFSRINAIVKVGDEDIESANGRETVGKSKSGGFTGLMFAVGAIALFSSMLVHKVLLDFAP
ncbi:MAG: hypothetical protein GY866_27160 [Proteobacteria bacterium]|nr:hypothetical protein [Pseudomonadota bacterium]